MLRCVVVYCPPEAEFYWFQGPDYFNTSRCVKDWHWRRGRGYSLVYINVLYSHCFYWGNCHEMKWRRELKYRTTGSGFSNKKFFIKTKAITPKSNRKAISRARQRPGQTARLEGKTRQYKDTGANESQVENIRKMRPGKSNRTTRQRQTFNVKQEVKLTTT